MERREKEKTINMERRRGPFAAVAGFRPEE